MLHGRIQTAGQSDLFAQIRTERGRVQRDPIEFLGFKPPNVDQQKIVKCVLVLFVLLFFAFQTSSNRSEPVRTRTWTGSLNTVQQVLLTMNPVFYRIVRKTSQNPEHHAHRSIFHLSRETTEQSDTQVWLQLRTST